MTSRALDHLEARPSAPSLASADPRGRRWFFVRAVVLAVVALSVATAVIVLALDVRTSAWLKRPRYPVGSLSVLIAAAWAIELHVRSAPRTIGWRWAGRQRPRPDGGPVALCIRFFGLSVS